MNIVYFQSEGSRLDAENYLMKKRSVIPMNLTSNETVDLNESFGSEGVCISDEDTETIQVENDPLEITDEFVNQQQFGEIEMAPVENVCGSIVQKCHMRTQTDLQTTIRFCNAATQTTFLPNASGVDAVATTSTQTDITWPKVEKERNHAQETICTIGWHSGRRRRRRQCRRNYNNRR